MIPRKIRLLNWILDSTISIGLFITIIKVFFPSGISTQWKTTIDLLIIVFNFIYYLIFESIFGRSPAKFITKTTVVADELNTPLKFKIFLIRSLSRYIPFEPLFILFNEDKLSLHDSLSKTKTIHIKYPN